MGLMTAARYVESIRDGRSVYVAGEKVADVTTHPLLQKAVHQVAREYEMHFDPELKELLTATDPESGEMYSRFYHIPRDAKDLRARHDAIEISTRRNSGMMSGNFCTDAILALINIVDQIRVADPRLAENVWNYYRHCKENHLTVAITMSDVKGDRSKKPYEQDDPDYYLRVVEERTDGIVIRGAKAHISAAPYYHELLVLPTKAMTDKEKEYSVACAVPANAPGVKIVCSEPINVGKSTYDYPLSARYGHLESLVIFDDVFVPWDRVFLNGQYQLAAPAAISLGLWQRYSAIAYKTPVADLLVGAAYMLADYNGIAKAPNIQERLFDLVNYAETIRAYGRAAAMDCVILPSGIAAPNPMVTNLGKYFFASRFHDVLRSVQDIGGAILATGPSEADFQNPELHDLLYKYMGTRKDVSVDDRMKVINLVKDLTASQYAGHLQIITLHAEGSMAAQKITAVREFYSDGLQRAVGLVKQAIGE